MKTTKLLLFTIIFIAIISLGNVVKAANDNLGTASALSSGASEVDGNTANVEFKFNTLNLTWYKADPSIGRDVDGYWVGYKMVAPSSVNSMEKAQKVNYRRKMIGQNDWVNRPFTEVMDGEWYMTAWAQVTQKALNQHDEEFTLYEAQFDWDGNNEYEQTVTIKINPKTTTLETSNKSVVTIKELGEGVAEKQTTFEIYKGKTLSEGLTDTEKNTLESIKNKKGFLGFYKLPNLDTTFEADKLNTYEKFDPDKDIINDAQVLVVAYFKVETKPEPEVEKQPEKDDTPKTGNTNIIGYIVASAIISAMGIAVLNKKH